MGVKRIQPASLASNSARESSASLNAWKSVLDTMEEQLDAGEAFVDSLRAADQYAQDDSERNSEDDDVLAEQASHDFSFSPPGDIGPIPAELVDRARAVLQRHHDLEAATQAAMNIARKHSDAAKAMRPSAPSVPVYFDGSL